MRRCQSVFYRTAAWMAITAGLLLAAPVPAADDGPCACWFHGYEDGMEFGWDNRHVAEHYGRCQQRGAIAAYDEGFKTAAERGERRCPYAR